MSILRVTHVPSGTLLAEGPSGRGIALFEGNYYVRRKYLCIARRKESSPRWAVCLLVSLRRS